MTGIEWTDATWNPVTGCSKVSPGCTHCYAETMAQRLAGMGQAGYTALPWTARNAAENVVLRPERLGEPLRWRKPRRVFVNSMSDLFHELVPDEFIDRVFAVMALTPQHTYQVLTKRPGRMRHYLGTRLRTSTFREVALDAAWRALGLSSPAVMQWPLPNVWLGVSAEDQQRADERIPVLLETPSAVRFVSAEPLLGPLDLTRIDWTDMLLAKWAQHRARHEAAGSAHFVEVTDRITETIRRDRTEAPALTDALTGYCTDGEDGVDPQARLDWVIVGGESGPGARPMDLAWARSIVAQCRAAGVAVFVKQLGAAPREQRWSSDGLRNLGMQPLRLRDRKGGNMEEWPEDLLVREFPEVRGG